LVSAMILLEVAVEWVSDVSEVREVDKIPKGATVEQTETLAHLVNVK
jgi:hypothetical protein